MQVEEEDSKENEDDMDVIDAFIQTLIIENPVIVQYVDFVFDVNDNSMQDGTITFLIGIAKRKVTFHYSGVMAIPEITAEDVDVIDTFVARNPFFKTLKRDSFVFADRCK